MTVKELIEQLKTFDDNMPVFVRDSSYCHFSGTSPKPIKETRWTHDGHCTLVIDDFGD